MEAAVGQEKLGDENTFSEQSKVEANYTQYDAQHSPQLPVNTNSYDIHQYPVDTAYIENNSTGDTSLKQQEYSSHEGQRIEKSNVDSQEESQTERKVDQFNSEYMLEQQHENVFAPPVQDETILTEELVAPEQTNEVLPQENVDAPSGYTESVNENFESQYESEAHQENPESDVQVPEVDNSVESKTLNANVLQSVKSECENSGNMDSENSANMEHVENSGNIDLGENSENIDHVEIEEITENVAENIGTSDNAEPIIEEIEEPLLENEILNRESTETDIKEEAVVTDAVREQIIIEPVPEDSTGASTAEEIIYTESDVEYSLSSSEPLEMTSSQVIEGEDGTIVTVETYRSNYTENVSDTLDKKNTKVEAAPKPDPKIPKQRKTRKSTFDVPLHVLGVDISKPNESVPNGRPAPKPRLGVKVPYRNLTSQIVTKAEIEQEVMERVKHKQEQDKANIMFARSLTQRLAKKIAPTDNSDTSTENETVAEEEAVDDPLEIREQPQTNVQADSNTIQNDSDLLAILEGEGEDMPVLPKELPTPQEDDSNLKALEREIALQQLQELPHQEPKARIFRGRHSKAPQLTPETPTKSKTASTEKILTKQVHEKSAGTPSKSEHGKNKENPTQSTSTKVPSTVDKNDSYNIDAAVSPKKVPIEVEPQVKVNMVLKTYSRKRKISDPKESLETSPAPKKPAIQEVEIKLEPIEPATSNTEVYITKSSRIIKKKVIWDPAEAQPRSPRPLKPSDAKTPPVKPIKPIDKVPSSEKVVEKKIPPKEKPVEKTIPPKKEKVSPEKKLKLESPKISRSPKPKKPRSEIDRLLMDEGAVKMLYELNNEEPTLRKKKDFYSVDKAEKEIIKKANELKNVLQHSSEVEPQKSLRKKEGPTLSPILKPAVTLERKMSKDSTRSSVQTPPGSPFPHGQGSMLIRRRSSSSLSSSDDMDIDDVVLKSPKKKSDVAKTKKTKKSPEKAKVEVKSSEKIASVELPSKVSKLNQYKAFTIRKIGKHVIIDLNYIDEKCYFTVPVLEELTVVLKKFEKDKDCLVVTLSSSSKAFCLGLDYASLISDDEDERETLANILSNTVRDYLECLLHFPKVLIACIQGDCVGLGVTMLPLFDMVIASDNATFYTPYSKLGCASEAGFLFSYPNVINHGLAAELLYSGQKLTAEDAVRLGLVSRQCWPEKYKETVKNIVTSISQSSKQALEGMKRQLRGHMKKEIVTVLDEESEILIDNWTSAECQRNFAQLKN